MGKKYLDTKEDSLESSILAVWQEAAKKQEKLDPVGKEDDDVDNDGDVDSSDKYLAKRRKAISKAIKKDKKEETDLEEGPFSSKSSKIQTKVAPAVRTFKSKEKPKSKKEEVEESYEIGTDEYRKHTQDVTPGEDGEWVDAVKKKNESMREALAKVWNTTEDKNPFKKEAKKDLTKEMKGGKTLTGKKVDEVDVAPKMDEKKK